MLSKTARTALRATLFIAACRSSRPVTASSLARELALPQNYLSKTLRQLVLGGVLVATRGPGGGHRLAAPAAALTLGAIVDVIDPGSRERTCLLGRPECSADRPCSAHGRWCRVRDAIDGFLDGTTLDDLRVPSPKAVLSAGAEAPHIPV